MSKYIANYLMDFVLPLIGELPKSEMEKYSLGNDFKFSHIGTAFKFRIDNRFFLATAGHCIKFLDGKIPRVLYGLKYKQNHPLCGRFLPIYSQLISGKLGEECVEDVAFYELDIKNNQLWETNKEEIQTNFFDFSLECLTIKNLLNLIDLSNRDGFIYGYPCTDLTSESKKLNHQLIPVHNIRYESSNPLYLEYDLEVPSNFDEKRLDGMSGGVLFCQDPRDSKHLYPIGMHIQGSNGIGHSITTPLFCKKII